MKIELPKQNNYEVAYNKAAELLRDSDLGHTSSRCGVMVREESKVAQKDSKGEKTLLVEYFGSEQRILMPEVRFQPVSCSAPEENLV